MQTRVVYPARPVPLPPQTRKSPPVLSASHPSRSFSKEPHQATKEETTKSPSCTCPFFLAAMSESRNLRQMGHIWQMFRCSAFQLIKCLCGTLFPRAGEIGGWTIRCWPGPLLAHWCLAWSLGAVRACSTVCSCHYQYLAGVLPGPSPVRAKREGAAPSWR